MFCVYRYLTYFMDISAACSDCVEKISAQKYQLTAGQLHLVCAAHIHLPEEKHTPHPMTEVASNYHFIQMSRKLEHKPDQIQNVYP